MDHSDERFRPLPDGDFRRQRAYLADHLFAHSDGPSPPPTDPVAEEPWRGLIDLPTDVLLRTTDYQGTLVEMFHQQGNAWIFAMPEEEGLSIYVAGASYDASDEFQAAIFCSMHGWYRQAAACLRTALEVMSTAAALGVSENRSGFDLWRAGTTEPKFSSSLRVINSRQRRPDLYNYKTGVLGLLYKDLSDFAHARSGSTNVDLWQSTGPIWAPEALEHVSALLLDTMAACYLLMAIGWSDFRLPAEARGLFGPSSRRWAQAGPGLLTATIATRHRKRRARLE